MSLIFGVIVATALTLVVIPLLYFMYVKTVGVEKIVPPRTDPQSSIDTQGDESDDTSTTISEPSPGS